jgi:hypothetical protein
MCHTDEQGQFRPSTVGSGPQLPSARHEIEQPLPFPSLALGSFAGDEKQRLELLLTDADFNEAPTRREQIAIACKHLRSIDGPPRFSFAAIGRFFGGLNASVIEQQWKKAQTSPQAPGRPHSLTPDVEKWISEVVYERYEARKPITYAELLDLLPYRHSVIISSDTLRHLVHNASTIKSIIGIPIEEERVQLDPAVIANWYADLARRIAGVPRQFIFNVDETGCNEFADKRETRVLVPITHPKGNIAIPVDRHSKRSTLTACIAADGFRMRPFVIVDRLTAEKQLQYSGYHESNVQIASQPNAFMTRSLFHLWADRVFFPTITERRAKFSYEGKVVLLMDGLGAHHTDEFLQECEARNIDVVFLVPHSSHQTQPLDVLTFALLKQRFSNSKFERLANAQSNKIVKILGAWFAASAPHHNVEAFMGIGLIPRADGDRYYLEVHPEKARRVELFGLERGGRDPTGAPPR